MTTAEDQARFLRCMGEPTRLEIVRLLAKGERCVGELTSVLNKEQSLISYHLRALKDCNIVKERQEAQKVYYKLTDPRLARLIIDCEALMKELSLCKCQEVNYERKANQKSGKR
ncbi:MAG: metalloregulator ArsR/SmtB family transcription factor [Dehalococcoidia bacterium]|nr:metalloregulator ArsR/SmtB family transcription factor [Dehalococcoidia bacterium]